MAVGRGRWLALLLSVVPLALAGKAELNLARDQSTDSATTAVILTERDIGHTTTRLRIWLHGITDLSLPPEQQRQVVLSNLLSEKFGRYARVSPGRYLVDVECERRHGINRSFPEELTIDAEAGKAYVIGCAARTATSRRPKAIVRETKGGVESQVQ